MTHSHYLSGLVAKRAELAGEIRLAEERLDQLRADVLHLDAATRIIDPAYHVDAIMPKVRRRRREWFGNGEPLRLVLETPREAPEPPTARGIAVALMGAQGVRRQRRGHRAAGREAGGRDRQAARGAGRAGGPRAAQCGVAGRRPGRTLPDFIGSLRPCPGLLF